MRLDDTRLALAGVLLIVGGEAFCLLGPLRYERLVHVACHAMFYTGIAIVAIAALGYARQDSGSAGKRD